MTTKANVAKKKWRLDLSDFLVVLCVGLVLAAILMPAIASTDPERAENILNAAATPSVFDGIVKPAPAIDAEDRISRREQRRIQAAARMGSAEPAASEGDTVHDTPETEGMSSLLTTDIRYREP